MIYLVAFVLGLLTGAVLAALPIARNLVQMVAIYAILAAGMAWGAMRSRRVTPDAGESSK